MLILCVRDFGAFQFALLANLTTGVISAVTISQSTYDDLVAAGVQVC